MHVHVDGYLGRLEGILSREIDFYFESSFVVGCIILDSRESEQNTLTSHSRV